MDKIAEIAVGDRIATTPRVPTIVSGQYNTVVHGIPVPLELRDVSDIRVEWDGSTLRISEERRMPPLVRIAEAIRRALRDTRRKHLNGE